ncbi:YfhO family protein [Butyrivibrio sp. AE3004]|uniref:YfhO family protein n=1 Tax=Butyrivibrio sp. AE3004 TaxID=1506994 RepID=UPI000494250D|nr:YfhO family protein [Butyrivibrio sp. AE3004]
MKKAVQLHAAAFLAAACLFTALCVFLHIAPFGDNTFLYEDMKQQYVDFFAYYHNVWHGADGFLYSENCGLGSDMFGIWAYYLTSPFLLMFIFIPDKYYAVAVTFLIMLKIGAMSATMSVFLSYVERILPVINENKVLGSSAEKRGSDSGNARGIYENCNGNGIWLKYTLFGLEFINIVIAVAFSFSAWMIANMTNIMWLDAVIVMPVLLVGYLKMMRSEKRGRLIYVISVMAMAVANYYIAAMILMFLGVFVTLLLLGKLKYKEEIRGDVRKFIEFIISTISGLVLDLWFLVPTVMSLMGSNKDHSGAMANAFSDFLPSSEAIGRSLSPFVIIPKLFSMSYDSLEIMNGLPNIYFGTVFVIPCILFFFNKKIVSSVRATMGAFLGVITLFFCIKPLNTLAHGGTEAYGYLYRYSFIFSFVCLLMVYMCLVNFDGVTIKTALISGFVAFLLLAVAFYQKLGFMGNKAWLINGALLVFAEMLIVGGICYKHSDDHKIVSIVRMAAIPVILMLAMADFSMNFICIYRNSSMNAESASGYMAKCEATEAAIEKVRELEKDETVALASVGDDNNTDNDYRIECLSPRTPNDSLHFDYNGTTTYNSLLKVENRLFMYKLGFNDNGLYTMYDADNTMCADAVLGIKYLIGADGEITENSQVLPAELTSGDNVKKLLEKISAENDPFRVQKMLWDGLTGQNAEMFYEAKMEASQSDTEETENGNVFKFSVTPSKDGELYFYMNRDHTVERSLAIYVNGEFVSGYGNASCQKVLDLGYFKEGEVVELLIEDGDHMGVLPAEPVVVTEDTEVLNLKN